MNNPYHFLSASSFLRWLVCPLIPFLCAFAITVASPQTLAETRYRTGLQAERGRLAVSPDGRRIAFTTDRLAHGMRLLDTESGVITQIPTQPGRNLGFPSWSPDGKMLVAVSADTHTGYYGLDGMRIVLLDTRTWEERIILSGDGVKFDPFFSADGKTIYYFKGMKRKEGKTAASRFDLFSVGIENKQEHQLTNEEYYEISAGDEDGEVVVFKATAGKNSREERGANGLVGRWPTLLVFDKATSALSTIRVEPNVALFNFSAPKRDKGGSLYFIAASLRRGGGPYEWYLVRSTSDGRSPQILCELPISMEFSIARNTGAIFVMDRDGTEIILRKLDITAVH